MILAVLVVCGIAYNLLTLVALIAFRRRQDVPDYGVPDQTPPVSILKPVRGRDEGFYAAIHSHAVQDYPEFELLFGTADPNDPAIADIERLAREHPHIPIRVIETANDAPNGKVGSLEILAREARFDTLLVNDGDIAVAQDYLRRVIGPLADAKVGLVTCLYHGRGVSTAARAEALGIATEFFPSVLVARLLSTSSGSVGFALGATMAFRRAELEAIGGFAAIREYLADDYQLGARIAATGKLVMLSDSVVETNLGAGSWASVWKHQVRWSRTIRVSRPSGYFGYALTQLTFWSVLAIAAGSWRIGLAGLGVRFLCAASYSSWPFWVWLRDLFGMCVWLAGLGGNYVEWRGLKFKLLRDGRIEPVQDLFN